MVKKANKRTRKKYKKGGDKIKDCNDRLEKKFPNKGFVWRRRMCSEDPSFGKETQKPSKPSIKDRASALEKQFGETGMRKTRKALRTTVGSCRAAVDNSGNKYYYNEAGESTYAAPETEDFNKICNPTDGIEKTGNKSGNCIGARYKGGEEYWYHPEKQFSTHDPNHPLCHDTSNFLLTDKEVNNIYNYLYKKEEKVESKKCGDYKAKECPSDECMLEPKKSAMKRLNIKNPKKLKRSMRKCLTKKTGGKRKKRKKSRKRRR